MNANVTSGYKFIQLDAVVLRACQQTDCEYFTSVGCPHHSTAEDLGTIAYWHRNPVRRAMFAVRQRLRKLV